MLANPTSGVTRTSVALQGGALHIDTSHRGAAQLEQLCGFASRQNPKRGFLFVSKVLGKHLPVRPRAMLASYKSLASLLQPFLATAKKTLFLGFAETATGLGAGVFEACLRANPANSFLFQQTTRYRFDTPVALHFQEEHSHSTGHILYEPTTGGAILHAADSVVLVDDELSTGKTAANFLKALKSVNPGIKRVALVSLLNWMGEARKAELLDMLPGIEVAFVSLLDGAFEFEPRAGYVCPAMPAVDSLPVDKGPLVPLSYGRFGEATLHEGRFKEALAGLALTKDLPVHIVGDGEFLHPPFLVAAYLERCGFDVRFQSTTRSPILTGHAIETKTCFADHYADGIENYAYNLPPEGAAQLVLCHESLGPLHLLTQRAMKTLSYGDLLCV